MLKLDSFAKLNLTLEIGKKLENSYHEIKSVMQQIDLSDNLEFKPLEKNKIVLECNIKELENENNLVFRTASLLKKKFNIKEGVEISIEKNIPIGAGLAGGSGNAAITLRALNDLWDLGLSIGELIKIGRELGSDIPFQLIGKTALVEGTGEIITKLNDLDANIIIVNPGLEISTREAYELFDKEGKNQINESDKLIEAINNKLFKDIAAKLNNDFEGIIIKKQPIIKEIKDDLIKNGALNALMSGSGPTVFGIFEDEEKAKKAFDNLKLKYDFIKLTKTIK